MKGAERPESGRFWKGVAQITRSRDCPFCSKSLLLRYISGRFHLVQRTVYVHRIEPFSSFQAPRTPNRAIEWSLCFKTFAGRCAVASAPAKSPVSQFMTWRSANWRCVRGLVSIRGTTCSSFSRGNLICGPRWAGVESASPLNQADPSASRTAAIDCRRAAAPEMRIDARLF